MKRKTFCCDASRGMYEDYYTRQSGDGMPVFAGAKYQRGHGLGSMLSGLFRNIIVPFFKRNAKTMASHAVKTGLNVADDVIQGKSVKESVKQHVPAGIKRTAQNIKWQTGSGPLKSKRRRRRGHHTDKIFLSKRYKDIFL